jgi:hypothetical protein
MFQFATFPQLKVKYSTKVQEFINVVEEKSKMINTINDQLEIPDTELKTIIEKYYTAVAEDPVGVCTYQEERNSVFSKNNKGKSIESLRPNISHVLGLIDRAIAHSYSWNFVRLINIPYFLRINILSISSAKHKSPIDKRTREICTVTCKIEEIIKGEKKFKMGETITLKYYTHITLKGNNYFEKGRSYFVPIYISYSDQSDLKGNYIVTFLGEGSDSYLIDNKLIYTKEDYFGIGEKSEWGYFKKQFRLNFMPIPKGGK